MEERETHEAEEQVLEFLRGKDAEQFTLTIAREGGAWDVTLSVPPHDKRHKGRGTGRTFAEAWHNIDPLWA